MGPEIAATADQIEATLNYLAPGIDAPFTYACEPPPGMPQTTVEIAPRRLPIRDGRPLLPQMSLDREGFLLERRPTSVVDFNDEAEVRRVYYPEIERLVIEATGAAKVVIFDHTLRNSSLSRQMPGQVREAADRVHNDYTEASAPQRVRDLLPPAEAEARLKRRYIEINLWRPIRGPVLAWPLAVCDARSIEERDLVRSERRYADRVGEIYVATYNPRHRWYYFPRMQRDEVLFIKCFDSARDGRARLSIHTAFEDPTTPANAPPRESIEVRAFAFF